VLRLEALFEGECAGTDLPSFIDVVEERMLPDLPTPYNDRHYLAALGVVVYYEKI
jgi:hypothetical protein